MGRELEYVAYSGPSVQAEESVAREKMRAIAMPGELQRIDIALRDFRNRAAI
jgi:hypothetical protein